MFTKKRAYFIEPSGGSARNNDMDQPALLPDDGAESAIKTESKHITNSYLKPTIISEGFEFIGEIKAACHVSVDGIVRGTISAPAVNIGTKGLVDASIHCENMSIKGRFLGKLDCSNLTVVSDAVADGELNFQAITIQRGGIVKGSLMKKQFVRS